MAAKLFKVIDNETGKLFFEGTAKMCCDKLGVADSTIRDAALEGRIVRGAYRVVDCSDLSEEVEIKSYDMDVVESWDKFCEPIRKKYNIPVYRAPGVKG